MDAQGYSALGAMHYRAGRLDDALAAFEAALRLSPHSAIDLLNGGSVLGDLGRYEEALAMLRKAERLAAADPALASHARRFLWSVLARYGSASGEVGEVEKAVQLLDEAARLAPADLPTAMSQIFLLNYLPGVAPTTIRARAEAFGQRVAELAGPPRQHTVSAVAPERLRIGVVSGDLRRHPVARFLAPLGRLDPARLEVFAYNNSKHSDDMTAEFKRVIPNWRDIGGLTDAAVAELIAQDGIHLLADLSGLSAGGRMGVFARRPAPVQVTWLGYFATTGLATMDYVLASAAVLPEADEAHWLEKPWRLPGTYIAFSPPDDCPPVVEAPVLRNGYVTFGSFNNARKLNPATIALWAEILRRLPGSRLVLRSSVRSASPEHAVGILRGFDDHGIEGDRISITPTISGYAEHLASYGQVDIGLDTHPFGGATTTCEALWMGVPVISRVGDRYVSRMGENILTAIGRSEWIAADSADYVEKAVELSRDIRALNTERQSLRQRVAASPIGDIDGFASSLANAFEGMWNIWSSKASRTPP